MPRRTNSSPWPREPWPSSSIRPAARAGNGRRTQQRQREDKIPTDHEVTQLCQGISAAPSWLRLPRPRAKLHDAVEKVLGGVSGLGWQTGIQRLKWLLLTGREFCRSFSTPSQRLVHERVYSRGNSGDKASSERFLLPLRD